MSGGGLSALEVLLSVLKDVLHAEILMEGDARKPARNTFLVSRNKSVKEQVWIPANSLIFLIKAIWLSCHRKSVEICFPSFEAFAWKWDDFREEKYTRRRLPGTKWLFAGLRERLCPLVPLCSPGDRRENPPFSLPSLPHSFILCNCRSVCRFLNGENENSWAIVGTGIV